MIKQLLQEQKKTIQEINHHYPKALKLLYVLFALDILFVLLHLYSFVLPKAELSTRMLRLDMTFGYSEIFQYLKFITVAVLLIILFFREKIGVLLTWSLFFSFLFVDDAFSIHEILGGKLVAYFGITGMAGLRGQDLGELLVVGTVGLLFLISFGSTLLSSGQSKGKRVTIHFFILIGILVFFGVGVDIFHSMTEGNIHLGGILTVIEDGGEMLASSLTVWYTSYKYLEGKQLIQQPKEEKAKSTKKSSIFDLFVKGWRFPF